MATKKKAEKTFEPQPDQHFSTNDWPLFRKKDLYRVKVQEDDTYVVVAEDGSFEFVSPDVLSDEYEPVKGPHKREF